MWDFPCAELSGLVVRVRATRTRATRNPCPRTPPFSVLWNTINTGSTLIRTGRRYWSRRNNRSSNASHVLRNTDHFPPRTIVVQLITPTRRFTGAISPSTRRQKIPFYPFWGSFFVMLITRERWIAAGLLVLVNRVIIVRRITFSQRAVIKL